ncbi:hypothetical protein FOZ60_007584 [Perkinsus olseni]|uniref:STEEP1 domain-containing protein n=2 Tax=Perkinsus olseni TaxID=32597 RepID=A0A7J6PFA2_PEROL|nr:hypothetical protein FOZ60_007584 [Perkinsus olseni]
MSSAPIYNFNQAVSADAFEVEEFRRRTRLHEKEAAEIEKSVSSIKPSRRIRMKRSGGDDATQQSAGSAEDEGGLEAVGLYASVAQSAERVPFKPVAAGSSPARGLEAVGLYASVAQSAERVPFKPVAAGSSPARGLEAAGLYASVAQSAERVPFKPVAAGSSPARGLEAAGLYASVARSAKGMFLSPWTRPTLLDLKHRHLESIRKDREEMQDQDGGYKRFQMEEYTSEDSHLKSKGKLIQYYCSLCGQMALVTDCPLSELPKRSTDGALALDEKKHFHKKYLALGQRVCLDRANDKIEIQYRYNCKNNRCGIPIAYRTTLEDTGETGASLFTYIIKGSLLKEQSKAARFNSATRSKFLDADGFAATSTEEE